MNHPLTWPALPALATDRVSEHRVNDAASGNGTNRRKTFKSFQGTLWRIKSSNFLLLEKTHGKPYNAEEPGTRISLQLPKTSRAEEKNDLDDLQHFGRVEKSEVNNKSKPAKRTRIHPSFMSSIHCCMYSSDIKQTRRAKLLLLQKCLCPAVSEHFQTT